jgi:hypothetical protein
MNGFVGGLIDKWKDGLMVSRTNTQNSLMRVPET